MTHGDKAKAKAGKSSQASAQKSSSKTGKAAEGGKAVQAGKSGKTGETGLAAGDHLHFGVYLHGLAVLPVEWWDQKWINDNVQPKLDGSSADNIERPKDTKPARKPLRRRKT